MVVLMERHTNGRKEEAAKEDSKEESNEASS
jgi:hypothetical protein